MKGIILAGGSGTRLYPITKGVVKQLIPVYDKPMVYYPLSVLMLAGITEVLVISTPKDINRFKDLLGSGKDIGMQFEYIVQLNPEGIAQALVLAEDFLAGDDACLILGDNVFYGHDLTSLLRRSVETVVKERSSVVFGYYVNDPERYGVVEFNSEGKVLSIEEKPSLPKSNYAVIGLYFYTSDVINIAKNLTPSSRGEFEITDVNKILLNKMRLKVELMGRGYAWLDTGTHESLIEASQFIETIEKRQGLKVACLEEIAYEKGYITKKQLLRLAEPLKKNQYGQYLIRRANYKREL